MPSKSQSPVSVVDDPSGLQKSDSLRQANTSKIKNTSNTISPNIMNKAVNASKKFSARKMSKRLQGLPKVMRSANLIKTSKTLSPPKNLINRFTKRIKSAPMVMNNVRKSPLTSDDVDNVKLSINNILNNANLDNEIVSVIDDYNIIRNLEKQFLFLKPNTINAIHADCIKRLKSSDENYSKMDIKPAMMKIGIDEVNKILNYAPINGGAISPEFHPSPQSSPSSPSPPLPPPPPRAASSRAAARPSSSSLRPSSRRSDINNVPSKSIMVQTEKEAETPPPPPPPPPLKPAHYIVEKTHLDREESLNEIVMQYVNEYIKERPHLMFGFIAAFGPGCGGEINIKGDIDEFNFSSYRIYANILHRYNDHEIAKKALIRFRFALFIKLLLATTLSLAFISITAAGLVKVSKLGKDAIALGVNNIYNLVLVNEFQTKEVVYFQKVINMVVPNKYAMGTFFTMFTLFGSFLKPPVEAVLRDTEIGMSSILMHTLLFFIELGILTRTIGEHLINNAIKKKINDVQPSNYMVSLTGQGLYRGPVRNPLATPRDSFSPTSDKVSSAAPSARRAERNLQMDEIRRRDAVQTELKNQTNEAARILMEFNKERSTGGKGRTGGKRITGGKRRRNVRQTRRRRR